MRNTDSGVQAYEPGIGLAQTDTDSIHQSASPLQFQIAR
jgi:hypothetical protein